MTKRSWLFGLILLCARPILPVAFPELSDCRQRIDLRADGSAAVSLFIRLADRPQAELRIPIPAGTVQDLNVAGFVAADWRSEGGEGGRFLLLTIPPGQTERRDFEVHYTVPDYYDSDGPPAPYGKLDLSYRFLNSSFERIGEFSAELLLPQGLAVHSVQSFAPKPKKAGMSAPYELVGLDGRRGLRMMAGDIRLGESVVLQGELGRERKSRLLLYLLVALALSYLVFFRDMLKSVVKSAKLPEQEKR